MKQAYYCKINRHRAPGTGTQILRATFIALTAIAAARMIFWGIDIYISRGGGGPGGEIFLPFYLILFFAGGWKLHDWTIRSRNRKEHHNDVLRDQRNRSPQGQRSEQPL